MVVWISRENPSTTECVRVYFSESPTHTHSIKNYFVELNMDALKASYPYLHDLKV